MATRSHGIFCLEGEWGSSMKRPASVEPLLALLPDLSPYHVSSVRRDVATRDALDQYLRKWMQKRYADHPILYLAFHGDVGSIQVGDGRRSENTVTLDDLRQVLADECKGRMIHFSSCLTMKVNGNRLDSFLQRTGALAVSGYTGNVDWLMSAACDLLVLAAMQENTLTRAGAKAMERRIRKKLPRFGKELGFRMVVRPR